MARINIAILGISELKCTGMGEFNSDDHYNYYKAMVFPAVMYGCESWTIKKAECQRIDAFELVLEKTLESPLDCKDIQPVHPKGNQH